MIGTMASTLIGINTLAWLMVALRPKIYGTKLYKPMLVNIKLSIAPIGVLMVTFLISSLLEGLADTAGLAALGWLSIVVLLAGLVVWVLLLPNAGYLITELNFNHRDHDKVEVPLWYDIVGVLTLAMSGVMNMCFNVFLIQFTVAIVVGVRWAASVSFLLNTLSWLMMALLMALASFGIYLGRYIRFNSWDVKHPVQFVKKMRSHFAPKGSVKNCALFILFHTLFFVLFYRATAGVVLNELLAAVL